MREVVVDASVALAWCFPDESSDYADAVLTSLNQRTMLVPSLWSVELANAIMVGERAKRLAHAEVKEFLTLLQSLAIRLDVQPIWYYIDGILPLARAYSLTAYDSSYLELAIRHALPLATLDKKLVKAAKQAGVKLFE